MITSVTNVTAARLSASRRQSENKPSFASLHYEPKKPLQPQKSFLTKLKEFFIKPQAPKVAPPDGFTAAKTHSNLKLTHHYKNLENGKTYPSLHEKIAREDFFVNDGPVFRNELQDDAPTLHGTCDDIEDRSLFGGNDTSCSDTTSLGGDD